MGRNSTGIWRTAVIACAAALAIAGCCAAATRLVSPSPNEAQPLVALLAADLAGEPSATVVLQRWCARRDLADPPVIVAQRDLRHDRPATAKVRELLRAAPDEPIRYRRVALACGRHVLSRADNWYRPNRLTPAMNAELDASDHPFGAVVRPLDFHRESLEAKLLLAPDAPRVPGEIIRNKALLATPDGTPFSLVVETYSKTILDAGSEAAPRVRSPRMSARRTTRATSTGGVVETAPPRHHREHTGTVRPRRPHEPRTSSSRHR